MELKPGYKKTEVGVIPEDWEVKRLGEVCLKINVGFVGVCEPFYTTSNYGILMIRTGNLDDSKLVLDDCRYVSRQFHARNKKSQVCAGDILIARHGNSGNAVRVPDEITDANTLNIVILRTNPVVLSNLYATYCINSTSVRKQATGMMAGSTQVVINTKEVERLRLPLPPIPEQKAIANALSDMDRLLSGSDSLIAKKRDIKQATMQQLLTGKTRLPGFSGEWEVKRLGEVATTIFSGKSSAGNSSGSFPVYGSTGKIGLSDSPEYEGSALLIARVGANAGRIQSVAGQYGVTDNTLILTIGESCLLQYFQYQLKAMNLNDLVYGSGQPLITGSILRSLIVNVPPLTEQQAIAKVLTDIDAELEALEQRRYKTRELKQAMMQELLTGRTRLV